MFREIGLELSVRESAVIGIFDLDNATVMKNTRDYLSIAEKKGIVETTTFDLPKSFTVTASKNDTKNQKIYISKFSPTTLQKRT